MDKKTFFSNELPIKIFRAKGEHILVSQWNFANLPVRKRILKGANSNLISEGEVKVRTKFFRFSLPCDHIVCHPSSHTIHCFLPTTHCASSPSYERKMQKSALLLVAFIASLRVTPSLQNPRMGKTYRFVSNS